MNFVNEIIIVFFIIIILTFLQKYYYIILYKIKSFLWKKWFFIDFIIRIWVIIHELSHLIFWIIWWSKVEKIELFNKNWWKVIFKTKNYIWSIWNNYHIENFFIFLFFNQIWIFLTSIWPLLVWLLVNICFIKYFNIDIYQLQNIEFNYSLIFFRFLYVIIIPSFILSYQDLKRFIISKQETKLQTISWSIINTIIFIFFIWFLTFLFEYFIIFRLVFCIYFLFITIIFLFIYLINYLIQKYKK